MAEVGNEDSTIVRSSYRTGAVEESVDLFFQVMVIGGRYRGNQGQLV